MFCDTLIGDLPTNSGPIFFFFLSFLFLVFISHLFRLFFLMIPKPDSRMSEFVLYTTLFTFSYVQVQGFWINLPLT